MRPVPSGPLIGSGTVDQVEAVRPMSTTGPLAEFVERLLRTTDPDMTVGEFVALLDGWLAEGLLVRPPDDPPGTYRFHVPGP